MSDLAEFLLARIAEDEAVTRAATDGTWAYLDDFEMHGMGNIMATTVTDVQHQIAHDNDREAGYGACESKDAAHIVRWQPARVLTECDAKRRIVKAWGQVLDTADTDPFTRQVHETAGHVFRCLALPYAEHEDYRKEWTP